MKQLREFITGVLMLLFAFAAQAQNSQAEFSKILQTYYKDKDKELVQKTINFVNDPEADFQNIKPIFTGFFGALFYQDAAIKKDFQQKLQSFTNSEVRELFVYLIDHNGPKLYTDTEVSPTQNDMYWSSYFATGDIQYVDKIIANAALSENRTDLGLFLTGASAKWSLCSNATQDDGVKNHLAKQKDSPLANEILTTDSETLKAQIINIIKEQRKKGIWN